MPFDSEPEGKFERRIFFSARIWWQDVGNALRLLTRLPLPRAMAPGESLPEDLQPDDEPGDGPEEEAAPRPIGRAVRAFPLIGALLGIVAGLGFAIATGLGLPDLVAGVVAIALLALATGALHEDGLADMADGFGGGQTAEKKLAIMRDSRIGAYGVMALVLVLAAKVGALADLSAGCPPRAATASAPGPAFLPRSMCGPVSPSPSCFPCCCSPGRGWWR
jgi:hypothetical protein